MAEDCRAYKPADEPFEHALRDIDLPAAQILHVAFGFKYDIAAAQRSACARPGSTAIASRRPARRDPTTSGATSGHWPGWPN